MNSLRNESVLNLENYMNIKISLDNKVNKITEYLEKYNDSEMAQDTEEFRELSLVKLTVNSEDYELILFSESYDFLKRSVNHSKIRNNSDYSNKIVMTIDSDNYEFYLNEEDCEYFEEKINDLIVLPR